MQGSHLTDTKTKRPDIDLLELTQTRTKLKKKQDSRIKHIKDRKHINTCMYKTGNFLATVPTSLRSIQSFTVSDSFPSLLLSN